MSGKAVVTVTDKRTVHTDALDILGRVITEDDQIGRDAIHLAVEPVVAGQTLHAGMEVGRRADGTFGYSNITKTLGIVDPFIRDVIQIGEKFLLVIYPRQITTLRHVWEHPEFGPDVINPSLTPPEPKLFHLIMDTCGPNKINTIKAIRQMTYLGLKESKDLTDNCPSFLLENVSYDAASIGHKYMMQFAGVKIVEAALPALPAPKVADPWTAVDPYFDWTPGKTLEEISKAWITQFAKDLKKSEYGDDAEGHTFDELMAIAKNYLETGSYGHIGYSDIYAQDWKTFWKQYKVLTGKGPAEGDDGSFFSCSC